jgi:hypothetical protein
MKTVLRCSLRSRDPWWDAMFVGTRVPVQVLIDYLEGGHCIDEFLDNFPTVTRGLAVAALEQAKAHLMGCACCLTSAYHEGYGKTLLGTKSRRSAKPGGPVSKIAGYAKVGTGLGKSDRPGLQGGLWKRGLWEWLYEHIQWKRRNSQAVAQGCARYISIPTVTRGVTLKSIAAPLPSTMTAQ